MILAISSRDSKMDHKSVRIKTDKTSFGLIEFANVTTDMAHYSQKLYNLRKQRWLFKAFPFLNEPPEIRDVGFKYEQIRQLAGEEKLSDYDKKWIAEDLKRKCDRLIRKIPAKNQEAVVPSALKGYSGGSKTVL